MFLNNLNYLIIAIEAHYIFFDFESEILKYE
jgi:hypothetical protein